MRLPVGDKIITDNPRLFFPNLEVKPLKYLSVAFVSHGTNEIEDRDGNVTAKKAGPTHF